MSVEGTLDTIPLPDLLQVINQGKKTGVFEVAMNEFNGKLFFIKGEVRAAQSTSIKETLFDVFIRTKEISLKDYKTLLTFGKTQREIFGKLLKEKKITKQDLFSFQKDQVLEIVLDFLSISVGKFKFYKGDELEKKYPKSLKIGMQLLLMGSIERIDEVESYEKRIKSNYVYTVKNELKDENKPAIYYEIFKIIDGNLAVEEVVNKSKRSKYVVLKIIDELVKLKAITFLKEKELEDEFKSEITQFLEVDPLTSDSKSFQLGIKFYNEKLYKQALEEFEKAIKIFPEDLSIFKYLGLTLYKLNQKDKAISILKKALNKKSNDIGLLLSLGKIYLKEKELEKAEKCLSKAISVKPDSHKAIMELANVKYQQRDFDSSIKLFKQALKINPRLMNVYNKLAGIYLKKNQKEDAIKAWKKVLEIDPSNKVAKRNLEILGKM